MKFQTSIKVAYQNFVAAIADRRQKRRLNDDVVRDIKDFLKKNCSRMSLDTGYRKKLIQSINYSLTHISGLIDQIPGPIDLDSELWSDQPVLHSIFLNPEEIISLLKSNKDLQSVLSKTANTEVFALLSSTLHKKTVLGTEKTGEILRRDVPKKSISFDNHQIIAPAMTISESQFKIKRLALNSLCSQTFKETADLQAWKKELEEQQALLKFKLSTEMSPDTQADLKETEQILSDIKNKLLSINNQINVTDEHLNRITRIFESPEKHMTLTIEKLKLDHLGFELKAASTDRSDEFSIAEFQFGQAPKRAAIWVRIKQETLSGEDNKINNH
jgi:hypothetical protein